MATEENKEMHDWEEDINKNVSRIAQGLVNGRIGFLFGAGMSKPSGGIGAPELVARLIRRGHFPHKHDPLTQEFEDQLSAAAARYPLEAIAAGVGEELTFQDAELSGILKELTFGGKEPVKHDGHTELSKIVQLLGSVRMLFTTNWDNLLKDALGDCAVVITPSTIERQLPELENILGEKTAIVHLHGTFEDKPLIREQELINSEGPLFQLLLGELTTKSFVFVGYSLNDPNIKALYYKAADILTAGNVKLKKLTYVVFPHKNEVDRTISEGTWKARNARYIPLSADEFFKRLHYEIETVAMDEIKDSLRKRLDVSEHDLNIKVDEIMAVFPDFDDRYKVLLYLDSITRGHRR